MTPLLDYISHDPAVQVVFITGIVFLLAVNFFFFHLRRNERQTHDLTIVNPPGRQVTRLHDDR